MIGIVGQGFVGSIFTSEFARIAYAGVMPRRFRLIDDDMWELRNAANQQVTLAQAGEEKGKAETMAAFLRDMNFTAEGLMTRLTEENAHELLGEARVIVDAVDNLATRQLLYRVGIQLNVPVLHLGISQMGTGVVDWSHAQHDTFHLAPYRTLGKTIVDPTSGVTPPCELARMRSVGWMTSYAAATALSLYLGFDPWGHLSGADSRGYLTEWSTSEFAINPMRDTWGAIHDLSE